MEDDCRAGLTYWDIKRLNDIKSYIAENTGCKLDGQTLADLFSIGASTLRRHFVEYFGLPLHTYVLEYRMKKAKGLLVNRMACVKEIAAMVGYKSRPTFSRIFISYFGHSPTYYLRE